MTRPEAAPALRHEGRSGTCFVIFFAVAFVALALFFVLVVSRAAPHGEGAPAVSAGVEEPAGQRSPSGSGGGLVAILLTVAGVGAIGAIAYREAIRGRRNQRELDQRR